MNERLNERRGLARARAAGLCLGVGLGGFIDGILLHQILQWHNMLSSRLPPTTMERMRTNMLGDGLFPAAVWLVTGLGAALLWGAARTRAPLPPTRWFVGLFFLGWGGFNLAEGVIDHHVLGIHHVRRYAPTRSGTTAF